MVLEGHTEDAPSPLEDLRGIEPRLHPAAEVLHPRLVPAREPPHQRLPMLQGTELGHSCAVEPGFQGPGLEKGGGGAGVHGGMITVDMENTVSHHGYSERTSGKSPGPKGRQHVAWGVSPRNRAPITPKPRRGGSSVYEPVCCRPFRAWGFFSAPHLGLAPQATCCRSFGPETVFQTTL